MENGIFQLVKVALSSIVALFGTWQIAANGVAQSIWSLAALAGVAMGPVFITVIGQCMGNGNTGIGTNLMKEMLRILKDRGYKQASLSVQKANYAVRMYQKTGFEIVDENEEEYIMLCRL